MAEITRTDIIDDDLIIYVYAKDLPDTYYVNQQWLQIMNVGYKGNIVNFIKFIHQEQVLPISFPATNYCALAEYLKEHFTYDLSQARRIIRWIDDYVKQPGDARDWGAVYLEILENARGF